MQWFRTVVPVIICEEIRADEGDLVSEELRKRAAQCIQRSVIRDWFGFLTVTNFIYIIPHMVGGGGLSKLLEINLCSSQILTSYGCIDVTAYRSEI